MLKPHLKIQNLKNIQFIFAGSPEFAAFILKRLLTAGLRPQIVLTVPDKPVGRKQLLTPPPVKIFAQKQGLEIIQPKTLKADQELIDKLKQLKLDVTITAALGLIVPKELLEIPEHGWLNIHPSLLPKYRGPSPMQTAILNGDQEIGTSIMLMDQGLDTGPIIAQKKMPIQPDDTNQTLSVKLATLSADLLISTLPNYLAGEIRPQPQDESQVSQTKIITKQDGKIDWSKSAQEIERQFRAFTPWPGIYTFWQNKILKVTDLEVINAVKKNPSTEIGKVTLNPDKKIIVQTGSEKIVLKRVQLAGKKEMSIKDFLIGHPAFSNAKLK